MIEGRGGGIRRFRTVARSASLSLVLPLHASLLSLVVLLHASALAAAAQPKKLEVAYSAISATQATLWFTKESGVFDAHGLDVNLNYVATSTKVSQALLAGEFGIAMAGSAVVFASLAGGDIVLIGGVVNVPAFYLAVTPEIKTTEQLRGRVLGVTRFGASSDFALRYALRQWGLEPDKDVKILQMGGQPEILAGMKSGAIHGGPIVSPFEVQAQKAGFSVLTDLSRSGLQYPMISLVSTRTFIKKDPDTVRAFLSAYTEGTRRFFKEKERALKVIAKYTRVDDREALESAYAYATQFVETTPRPPLKGIEVELAEIAKKQPEARGRKAEEFVDMRFFEELEKRGMFK